MRIGLLIPTIDEIGGAERQTMLLAQELAARGHAVTLVALSGAGAESAAELRRAGVCFVSLGMRKAWIDPRGWLRYLAWARQFKPQIVHAHLPHASWFARWVRVVAPVRVLIDTIHTSHAGSRWRRMGYRVSHWLTDHVTCVSGAVAVSAVQSGAALRENLSVVANGVLLPKVREAAPAEPERPFRWIAVGRLARVKDYATLLRAFATLAGAPTLQIVGAGPEESSLREFAAQLGIESRVQFAGFQRAIAPLLASADGFALSSLWEGLPVGLLEAAAAGLPVVATDGNGTREAMLPGRSGLLVPVGDAAALGKAMAAVMALPRDERRTMGASGRRFVEERFSLPVVASQWERLYERLLHANPKPKRWHG